MGFNFVIEGDFNTKKNILRGSRLTRQKLNCDFHSRGISANWPTDTYKIPDLKDFFITKGVSIITMFKLMSVV